MRNLTFISGREVRVPIGNTICATYDLDEDIVYVASERYNLDGEVEVDLWKVTNSKDAKELDVPEASFHTISSSDGPSCVQTISLRFVGETRKITAIMRGGDVIVVSVEEEGAPFEVEGTFESGILAAAWNPDESVVAIVTGERKLILLSSLFDVLVESPLYTEDFGQDAPINVGWGSKQTQFHGSLGKSAAQETNKVKGGVSPDDDLLPRISWRGDGAYFVVSSLSPAGISGSRPHRTLRVYDRQGVLQSTSEDVPGLEHSLVWRPSGNVIAGTQRFGFDGGGAGRDGRHDVVFFERNGLRHGEFSLKVEQLSVRGNDLISEKERKWGYLVREMAWNSDSSVLAIWIEGDKGDVVQFWTIGNYHWYLKHEIAADLDEGGEPGRFTSLSWHPEKPLRLLLTTPRRVFERIYSWDTFISRTQPPNDSGAVGVIDGPVVLLTPFRSQNVPPPMSSHQLVVSPEQSSRSKPNVTTPIYITFSCEDDALGVLWEHGYVELWSLKIRLVPGNTKIMDPSKVWSGWIAKKDEVSTTRFRQLSLKTLDAQTASYFITTLGVEGASTTDFISVATIEGGLLKSNDFLSLPGKNTRLLTPALDGVYEMHNGDVFAYDPGKHEVEVLASFGEFCIHTHHIVLDNETYYIGLSKTGKLYVSKSKITCSLSTIAISLAIASKFVIFTTTTHEVVFVPFTSLPSLLAESDAQSNHASERVVLGPPKEFPAQWSIRKVERGSRIVVAVPSSMSLVMQMPRGNLETINPRPLVLKVVNQDLDAGLYRKAFFACRKHRIDFNVIVDRNLEKFLNDIPSFVDQVPEVDHINLLLTLVGRGNNSPEVVAKVCNAFRRELEMRNLTTYVNSILTAHVVKSPPDHEAGLSLLLRLRDSSPDVVEDAVKYIIFLVDANELFNTALGMYDFSLVIMIAQHAQKDPREYLPFLRELRALDKYYQRFRIDDHLKRYESALKNLNLAGSERFEEAVTYIEEHRLYRPALTMWKGTDHYKEILNVYGDYLYERREFREAALGIVTFHAIFMIFNHHLLVFIEAGRLKKGMVAHEKALEWQELFDIAVREDVNEEDIVDMGYRVAEELSSKKRYKEAAQVFLDYCKDIRYGVIALVSGNMFSEARRIVSLNAVPEVVEDVIYPAAFESRAQVSEDLGEMREQLTKQVNRLRELRIKKIEEPDAFYGTEDNQALHNVDVMTDISMAPTSFTRYTVAPTAASRTSRRTSRSKRKMERKVGSGRKGTVDEEEYLLNSVNKVVDRFNSTLGEARGLLPHLFQFTQKHREEGLEMQREVGDFETELKAALGEVWAQPSNGGVNDGETALDNVTGGWAERMAEKTTSARVNPLDRVEKREISYADKDWRVPLYDIA